jgi:hypothetical protein
LEGDEIKQIYREKGAEGTSRKHWMMKPPKKRKTMSWMRKMK